MSEKYSKDILKKYDENHLTYDSFGIKLCSLVEDILMHNDIRVHSITYRIKERKSLEQKITRSIEKYNQCEDVTDIVGVRIITFLQMMLMKWLELSNLNSELIQKIPLTKEQF